MPQHLRLAQDHRIEAGSDPEKMPDDILLPEPVKVGLEGREVAVVIFGEKRPQDRRRLDLVPRVGHQFHAVAGGQNHPLENSIAVGEGRHRARQPRFLNVHPFSHLDGRSAMIDSHQ